MKSAISAALVAAAFVVSGCETPRNIDPDTGALIGAGTGAVVGGAVGDGGVIAPAIGAVTGAVVGEEAAERDPLFD